MPSTVQRLPELRPATIRRCSSTESDGKSRRPCGTKPMPSFAIRYDGAADELRCRRSGSSPLTRAGGMPRIALQSVVLPIPLRPTIAVAPGASSNETSWSAWAGP